MARAPRTSAVRGPDPTTIPRLSTPIFQLRLISRTQPAGWLAAQGRGWPTPNGALAYLQALARAPGARSAELLRNGVRIATYELGQGNHTGPVLTEHILPPPPAAAAPQGAHDDHE